MNLRELSEFFMHLNSDQYDPMDIDCPKRIHFSAEVQTIIAQFSRINPVEAISLLSLITNEEEQGEAIADMIIFNEQVRDFFLPDKKTAKKGYAAHLEKLVEP